MDTSTLAMLTAYATDDVAPILAALPWDAREDIAPPGLLPVTVGRVGTFGVTYSDATGLGVHDHDDEEGAVECFTNKVRLLREAVEEYVQADFDRYLPDVQVEIEDMTGYVGRHEAPDEPRWI